MEFGATSIVNSISGHYRNRKGGGLDIGEQLGFIRTTIEFALKNNKLGPEVLKKLATYINNEIVTNAKMTNRGVKQASYYVIKNMLIPSVLVELGFISNSEDRQKLINDKYVEIYAQSIYNGIVDYYAK